MPSTTNSKTMPIDMTTPWDSSGGIQVYWDGEGRTMTQSKPKLEEVTFKASKIHCLVPLTEELLEDAPAMDAYLRKKAPEKLDFSISDETMAAPVDFDSLFEVLDRGPSIADRVKRRLGKELPPPAIRHLPTPYPHIVLRKGEHLWTSVHVAMIKPAA
jgi:hypothetical protein